MFPCCYCGSLSLLYFYLPSGGGGGTFQMAFWKSINTWRNNVVINRVIKTNRHRRQRIYTVCKEMKMSWIDRVVARVSLQFPEIRIFSLSSHYWTCQLQIVIILHTMSCGIMRFAVSFEYLIELTPSIIAIRFLRAFMRKLLLLRVNCRWV